MVDSQVVPERFFRNVGVPDQKELAKGDVAPEDYEGYADLRRRLPMAIAGGENEHSLYGFNALFEGACVDIAQPDIGSCGGFTAARHITALGQAKGVEINP